MDLEQIQDLENRLKFQLPTHYKDFLLNYPQELTDSKLDVYFCANDVEWLYETISIMKDSVFFPIGMDLGGNYFFLNKNNADTCIYYVDHEELEDETATLETILNVKYNNLEEFKIGLIELWGELIRWVRSS